MTHPTPFRGQGYAAPLPVAREGRPSGLVYGSRNTHPDKKTREKGPTLPSARLGKEAADGAGTRRTTPDDALELITSAV